MKIRTALLAATMLAAPLVAKAQPIPGLYISGGLGGNVMSSQTLKSLTVPTSTGPAGTPVPSGGFVVPLSGTVNGANVNMNGGFAGMGSIGWSFGPITSVGGPRVEVEGLYLNNSLSGTSLNNPSVLAGKFNAGGTEQKYGGFVNAIWDFDVGSKVVYPYIGAGVGGMVSEWSTRFYNATSNNPSLSVNNSQSSFAYQGIVGVSFAIPQVPGLAVFTDFRFEGLEGNRNYAAKYSGPTTRAAYVPNIGTVLGTAENYNYTFLLGVKYAFNAAPPPPPPAPVVAPAPAPARSYLVFFDWDKYNLTDRARQIIREAAENSTRVQYTRIAVNGYTDTTGTPQYNMGLSIRRANAVAAELVRNGVPKSAISIQGFGETHLLVPTGDQVREPQNRRVEIIIQ